MKELSGMASGRTTGPVEGLLLSVSLLCLVGAAHARSSEAAEHQLESKQHQAEGASVATMVKVPDVSLVDQEGHPQRMVSDVIGDRIVVMNFIYTSCKTACPMSSAIFGLVQERLASRPGEDVQMVSLTVDPVTDTPARLRAFSKKVGAREGWQWLTGEKPTVDSLLEGLGVPTPSVADHPTVVLIGDGRTGRWVRLFGFPSPDEILAQVDRLKQARASIASDAGPGAVAGQSRMIVPERGEQ